MNKKELLFISIAVFLTIVAWLTIDIYQIKQSRNDEKAVKPLTLKSFPYAKQIIDSLKIRQP